MGKKIKVFVTGASGLVGTSLLNTLSDFNCQVHALTRSPVSAAPKDLSKDIIWHCGDIRGPGALAGRGQQRPGVRFPGFDYENQF